MENVQSYFGCQQTTFKTYNPKYGHQWITFSAFFDPFQGPNQQKLLVQGNMPCFVALFINFEIHLPKLFRKKDTKPPNSYQKVKK
jgi:hypothetical protein